MKWTALIIVSLMLLSFCALGQPNQYATNSYGGAPTPTTPTSPDALGFQTPTPTSSSQAPSVQESSQGLMKTSQQMAYSYSAPQGQGQSQGMKLTATSPTVTKLIVPPGGYAPNSLYVAYAPQTVAGCYLYANLPLWLQVSSSGSAWFYEWYPSGQLDVNYAGYIYSPGWYKRWFFADVPGWHILQYYCNGWSNYAYIYVYGQGSNYWVNPVPYNGPIPYPYSPFQSGQQAIKPPATGHTYYNYQYTSTNNQY